jgi:hypothetical protein
MTEEQRVKHNETNEWMRFCKEKIVKIEKLWNRKLEESTSDGDASDNSGSGKDDNPDHEDEDDNLSHE